MNIKVKKLHPEALIPTRAKPGDSGLDLYACLPAGPVIIMSRDWVKLGTGIAVELPEPSLMVAIAGAQLVGYEAQVRSRSGLTSKGIVACGGLGTVDNGYRGEIGVTLFNHSREPFVVRHGDRIAQLVVCPVAYPVPVVVDELSETERGAGGFGSTGV